MPSPFVKGNKLGKGRPKGLKNKTTQNYLDLGLWAGLILKGAKDMKGHELVDIGFRALALLLTKVPNLPGTPAQSVENVKQLFETLEIAEKKEDAIQISPVDVIS